MIEYIIREEAKAKIREKFKKLADRIEVNEVLNSIPAADVAPRCPHYIRNIHDQGDDSLCEKWGCEVKEVAPVRHGRWVKTVGENGVTSACRCNLCGYEDNRYSLFSYCPNCGAKMEVDE